MDEMKAIEIKNLHKNYGFFHAVKGVNLDIEQGEIFGFLGPNGAGKTTTIRCLMDFIRPTSGSVKIFGQDAQKNSVELKKKIGYLSGDVRLWDGWTGMDHVKVFESIRGNLDYAKKLFERLNLDPDIRFKNLSSGNKQKLGLVLALAHEPDLLILDEPTVGLDPLLQNTIYEILREFHEKGRTVFMSSHYLHEVEMVCDRVGIIKDGKMVTTESIHNLKRMKLYTVTVYFSQNFDEKALDNLNAKIIEKNKDHLVFQVKGDINGVIKMLSQHQFIDVEIARASLEDIFLEYYKE